MKIFKSRTFWGALLYIVTTLLEAQGIVPTNPALIIESAGIGLGLYGARNVKK